MIFFYFGKSWATSSFSWILLIRSSGKSILKEFHRVITSSSVNWCCWNENVSQQLFLRSPKFVPASSQASRPFSRPSSLSSYHLGLLLAWKEQWKIWSPWKKWVRPEKGEFKWTSSLAECHPLSLASVSVSASLSSSVGWTSVIGNLRSPALQPALELFVKCTFRKHHLPQILRCITANRFLEIMYRVWPGLLYDQQENAPRLQRTKRSGNHKTICGFLYSNPDTFDLCWIVFGRKSIHPSVAKYRRSNLGFRFQLSEAEFL